MTHEKYQGRYELFKSIVQEESAIISILKDNLEIDSSSKILDVGGNNGFISHSIQPKSENITVVDIKETGIDSGAKFIKEEWEKVDLSEKYDIVLASHVLGYLGHEKSLRYSIDKMKNHLKPNGSLTLCYNANTGFMEKLVEFAERNIQQPMYDYFDESLVKDMQKKEISFNTYVKGKDFQELTELTHILSLCPDDEFDREESKIKKFLGLNLEKPEFTLEQKIMILNP